MRVFDKLFSIKNDLDRKVIRFFWLKFTFSRYKMQKVKPFDNNKPTIALQLNQMDKGGLEEVVLQLATSEVIREKYNTVIISEFTNKGYLAEIARKNGIPVYSFFGNTRNIKKLVKTLNIKIVHFHYNFTGIEEYKNYAVKTIYTIHNNYIWLDKDGVKWRNRFYPFVDEFIAVSSQVKEYFCEKFGINENKIKVIPNGIEYTETENIIPFKKSEVGFNEDDFVMVNVASFNPNKYHFTQIKALYELKKKYNNIKLLLIGNIHDEIYYKKIKEMISDNGLVNDIKILDFVPKNNVYKYLKMADCFIMTSLTEGFSIAMSEAMMLGKPMILTDIGGARDAIDNNDIGILVSHTFKNKQDINMNDVIEKFTKNEFYFDNVQETMDAIEDMYQNKDVWKQKGLLGKDKIKNIFNVKRVQNEYFEVYKKNDYVVDKEYVINLLSENNFEIAIMAPCPIKQRINEGWMSRIFAIDNIISNKKRIYINPFLPIEGMNFYKHSDCLFELQMNKDNPIFNEIISLIVQRVKLLYCHTLHLAEYVIDQLDTNKIVVDIHGVTPEEEVMLGHPENKDKYEKIEKLVLEKAKYCVMVTNAMKIHYANKYPDLKPNCIILPIVELLNVDEATVNKINNNNDEIIYSGGIQAWQNLDAMLNLAVKTKKHKNYVFLSNDYKIIERKARKLKIKNAKFKVVSKDELKNIYDNVHFGMVLRDDSPVNFVACPTKIYEYMACGIIPVVRTTQMGDFLALGYKYVTEERVLKDELPSKEERKQIILNNFEVVKKMQKMFKNGIVELVSALKEGVNI